MAAEDSEGVRAAPFAVSSTGLLMVGFLMVVSGIMYLNTTLHILDADESAYHVARLIICAIIVTCACVTLSKGMLTSSIIMVVTAVSCLTFTLSYMVGFAPSRYQDTLLSILLYVSALVLYKTGDHLLCVATVIYAVSMTAGVFVNSDTEKVILGLGLTASGLMYTICATAAVVQYECGIVKWKLGSIFENSATNDIAQTPYERSVPLASVTTGMMFLFMGIATYGDIIYIGDMFTLAVISFIVLGMSVYMFSRGILAEGVLLLLMSVVNLLTYVPPFFGFDMLPSAFATVIMIPTVAVTVLCVKRRDWTLIVASSMFALNLLVTSAMYMSHGEYYLGNSTQLLWAISGLALLYHGVSRWLFVCARREVIPLLSGNLEISDGEAVPTPERKKTGRSGRLIDISILIMAMLLFWNAFYDVNSAMDLIKLDALGYGMIKSVLAFLLLLSSFSSIRRGRITEALLFILTAVSCLTFAIMTIFEEQVQPGIDRIFGLFLLLCGMLHVHRGSHIVGSATILFALGMMISATYSGGTASLVSGVIQFAAGVLYATDSVYRLGWAHTSKRGWANTEDRHMFDARETIVTLGYLNLTVVMLCVALLDDLTAYLCIIIHSMIVIGLGVYAVYKNVIAEGLLIMIPTMLALLIYTSVVTVDNDLPPTVYIFLAYMLLCPLAMFVHRRNTACVVITAFMAVEAVTVGFIETDAVKLAMILPLATLIGYSLKNWISIERLEPTRKDSTDQDTL